jgi:hypothetical protein
VFVLFLNISFIYIHFKLPNDLAFKPRRTYLINNLLRTTIQFRKPKKPCPDRRRLETLVIPRFFIYMILTEKVFLIFVLEKNIKVIKSNYS